ncbi:hypothetical protein J1605_020445 [Eschrichtius robustus]|uniref:Uncharacterized protein n=1 Tax=Eschrichtius robustus TaxID=9764 RepID=A0AB34HHZ6_ESCRO|nr:hypothetical protein J1605_020445 [Eschrichtius robustus]
MDEVLECKQPSQAMRKKPHAENGKATKIKAGSLTLWSTTPALGYLSLDFFYMGWASLVAQWLRIHLPMQGTRVRALAREDPTCHGAAEPVCHNY